MSPLIKVPSAVSGCIGSAKMTRDHRRIGYPRPRCDGGVQTGCGERLRDRNLTMHLHGGRLAVACRVAHPAASNQSTSSPLRERRTLVRRTFGLATDRAGSRADRDLPGRHGVRTVSGGAIRERTMSTANGHFDPETLAVLKAVFEEACGSLPPHRRTQEIRSELAVRILKFAGRGRRDSTELRVYALMEAASPSLGNYRDL